MREELAEPQLASGRPPAVRSTLYFQSDTMARVPDKLLITVAPTGAESAKTDVPQLPTTLDELVETAKRCEKGGAARGDVDTRDEAHKPTIEVARLTDTVAALRDSTDLVVQLPTGGAVHDPLDQ